MSDYIFDDLPGRQRICDRSECSNPAKWAPGFRLYPRFGDEHADSITGLAVCDECKAELKIGDLLSDEGWEVIVAAFASHGKIRPCRKRTELRFTLLRDVPGELKPRSFVN